MVDESAGQPADEVSELVEFDMLKRQSDVRTVMNPDHDPGTPMPLREAAVGTAVAPELVELNQEWIQWGKFDEDPGGSSSGLFAVHDAHKEHIYEYGRTPRTQPPTALPDPVTGFAQPGPITDPEWFEWRKRTFGEGVAAAGIVFPPTDVFDSFLGIFGSEPQVTLYIKTARRWRRFGLISARAAAEVWAGLSVSGRAHVLYRVGSFGYRIVKAYQG